MTEPVLMIRAKDFRPKPTSRYASGSVTNSAKKKRKKTPNKIKPTLQHVLVLDASGKFRWIWREI